MKKQAEEWLIFANYDALVINELIKNEQLTSAVAFHAQQCIEKSFKALLALRDRQIPRIHDLRKLFKLISRITDNFDIEQDLLDQLNQVYIDTRYPADFGLLPDGKPSQSKVNEFSEMVKKVYKQVESIVQESDD